MTENIIKFPKTKTLGKMTVATLREALNEYADDAEIDGFFVGLIFSGGYVAYNYEFAKTFTGVGILEAIKLNMLKGD